ncbi:MAG: YggS family pyridoxal phosphate-dependent enzyme [Campylobacterales bacterium]
MTKFMQLIKDIEECRLSVDRHRIIKIVAISKYVESSEIEPLYKLGHRAFGESRVQDLKQKSEILSELPIEWHFVGRLQSNKINQLLDLKPALIHSIDSLKTAQEVEKRAEVKGIKVDGLLQINSAYEESKAGVSPEEAVELFKQIKKEFSHLNLVGVMTIGAHSEDKELVKQSFLRTKEVFDELQSEDANILSMGMSSDFRLAIECGSNMLRVGSAIF